MSPRPFAYQNSPIAKIGGNEFEFLLDEFILYQRHNFSPVSANTTSFKVKKFQWWWLDIDNTGLTGEADTDEEKRETRTNQPETGWMHYYPCRWQVLP